MAKKRAPQGLLPFEYAAEPDGDEVTARAGLPLLAEVMQQIGMPAHLRGDRAQGARARLLGIRDS